MSPKRQDAAGAPPANRDTLVAQWLEEQRIAHIHGWDFSHIHGRYTEEDDLPWDFAAVIREYLKPADRLLDEHTGGGEFLLSLAHPHHLTSATEGYPPNAALCKERLAPLGIDIRDVSAGDTLPFGDASFDVVTNRHGALSLGRVYDVLKPGGYFLTQQVGAFNDRELVDLLLPDMDLSYPEMTLERVRASLAEAGFAILRAEEAFQPIRFFDVGALVWFARIIDWEFPGFMVEQSLPALHKAQDILERDGCLEGRIHRLLLVARKPG